jgi:septum formation protein
MAPELIVATTSRYRLALLDQLGVKYRAAPHKVDERARQPDGPADEIAATLARLKAESLAGDYSRALILGSDQVVELGGEILHKPGDEPRAVAQLVRMQGRAHRIVTAVALRRPDGTFDEVLDVHVMHMRPWSEAQLTAYVAAEQPIDCAGSYKLEGRGIALFERIEGHDHTGIIGLPLIAVSGMLARAGIDVIGGAR